jgi:taurine dioxygenase
MMDYQVIDSAAATTSAREDSESGSGIEVRPLTVRVGAEVLGVDLREDLSDAVIKQIEDAIIRYGVIFFRDQNIGPDGLLKFGQRFGVLEPHSASRGIDGYPEIIRIHADETSKFVAGEKWHSDSTCNESPPMGTMLNLHIVPPMGGDTVFTSMSHAYDSLSPAMKAFLDPLTAVHDGEFAYRRYANMEVEGSGVLKDSFPSAIHPVVRTHPVSGRKVIFVNEAFTTRIVELGEGESRRVLDLLFDTVKDNNFQCRFRWRQHSMAFWDNRAVQHLAVRDYAPNVRSGLRINVAGDRPR